MSQRAPERTRERTRQLLRPEADVRRAWPQVLVYAALSFVAISAAEVRGQSPLALSSAETWLLLPHPLVGHALGLALGVVLALATISATRLFVKRWDWARALHVNLQPAVRGATNRTILVLGLASAIGEELFFRGLLGATFGLIASSLAFGVLHQMRGNVRWVWAAWATIMGVLFCAIFFATGSLLGPIVAHAVINVANLRFLRDTDLGEGRKRRAAGISQR